MRVEETITSAYVADIVERLEQMPRREISNGSNVLITSTLDRLIENRCVDSIRGWSNYIINTRVLESVELLQRAMNISKACGSIRTITRLGHKMVNAADCALQIFIDHTKHDRYDYHFGQEMLTRDVIRIVEPTLVPDDVAVERVQVQDNR